MEHLVNRVTRCVGCGELKLTFFAGAFSTETPGLFGATHLMEHCMCERVKEIEPEMKRLGLIWNAATSNTRVTFFLSGLIESVDAIRDRFLDCILNYDIPRDVFERERKVVISEYSNYFHEQIYGFWLNFNRVHYGSYDSLGLRSDLESLTYERFMEYHDRWFRSPSFIGYVHDAGHPGLDAGWLREYGDQYGAVSFSDHGEFDYVERAFSEEPVPGFEPEPMPDFEGQSVVLMDMGMGMGEGMLDRAYAWILKGMLGDGLTSLLYREIREKTGHAYGISVWVLDESDRRMNFQVVISMQEEYADEIRSLLKGIMENLPGWLSEEEFKVELMKQCNDYELNRRSSYSNEFSAIEDAVRGAVLEDRLSYGGFREFLDRFQSRPRRYFLDSELNPRKADPEA